MSIAEDIVARGQVPVEWQAEADKMHADHIAGPMTELDKVKDKLVPVMRHERDDDGNVVLGENDEPNLVIHTDSNGLPLMEPHPLKQTFDMDGGFHAYRYEECSDGSIVAVYVTEDNPTPRMKAFADIEEASLWSPRDERVIAE